MAVRWISLSRGNGNPRALANASWQNGVSPLMARTRAPSPRISEAT